MLGVRTDDPYSKFANLFDKKLRHTSGENKAERRLDWLKSLMSDQFGRDELTWKKEEAKNERTWQKEKFGKTHGLDTKKWDEGHQLGINALNWKKSMDEENLLQRQKEFEERSGRYSLHPNEFGGGYTSFDTAKGVATRSGQSPPLSTSKSPDDMTSEDTQAHVRYLANLSGDRTVALREMEQIDPNAVTKYNEMKKSGKMGEPWYTKLRNDKLLNTMSVTHMPWLLPFRKEDPYADFNKAVLGSTLRQNVPIGKMQDKRGLPKWIGGTPY